MSLLLDYVNHQVSVITCDGRVLLGLLRGFDQNINIILEEAHERVYSIDSGVQQLLLGLYMIRGDNVAAIGLIDKEKDNQSKIENIQAEPLKPIIH